MLLRAFRDVDHGHSAKACAAARLISTILVQFPFSRSTLTFQAATPTLHGFTTDIPEYRMNANHLSAQHCRPRKGKTDVMDASQTTELLRQLPGWTLRDDGKAIAKDFRFDDFHHTLGFINAVGFMANQEDHHPDLEAGYGHCQLTWSTHDVGGLSMNDFICASRVEALLER
jgi:4a-hydroxytetrahydrobiopterin dehydratase